MIKCPNCGKRNRNDNKFCGECGTDLSEAKMICPNCEKIHFEGENFCTNCGSELFTFDQFQRWKTNRDTDLRKETIERIKNIIEDQCGCQKIPRGDQEGVLIRDSHRCRICGSTNNVEVDYIKLPIDGGINNLKNLQTICLDCNYSRYSRFIKK